MRSRSGPGMAPSSLAVATKTTLERSKGSPRYVSVYVWFCEGSSTSSSADMGSPRASLPTLSTSSSSITGSRHPARLRPWITRPGIAPMYVRRCPRISASSRTPPSARRASGRPSTAAIASARLVLPTPGGPMKQRMGPGTASLPTRRPTATYSRMRCFTLLSPSCPASSARFTDSRLEGGWCTCVPSSRNSSAARLLHGRSASSST
mmetsp:Transcript_47263/g.120581  ORF Transcript_47263/g.120581 Transcript_47263/m.120581 type:complete len:207 (-) Transcript_47263:1086-1706(-)